MTYEEIRKAALQLDLGSRAKLARHLLTSLEELTDGENAAMWAKEAQRRNDELSQNPDLAVDGETVRQAAFAKYPRK